MTTNERRVAIITGGSRGIGREITTQLAGNGYDVVVNYATDAKAAADLVAEIGGRALAVPGDVADEHAVKLLFDTAEREYGGVDVVVHCAAVMPSRKLVPMAELDLAELDRVLRVNVRGTFAVSQQAARRVRPGGAIINLSSSVVRFNTPGYAAYAATKGAVNAVTKILARELRGRDVTVNTIAPGSIETDMFRQDVGSDPQRRAQIAAASPMERVGTPADIARVVLALAGPVRWINGEVLYANGGAA
jgi:3-oxoacyl-[acyl-carrier protein] reductase